MHATAKTHPVPPTVRPAADETDAVLVIDDEPRPVRFTLDDYFRFADAGFLDDGRYEFIAGDIYRMPPQKNPHAYSLSRLGAKLERLVGERLWVRTQATLLVGDNASPEPDIAVLGVPPYAEGDYPTSALLVIEISDTTLRHDRARKSSLYAAGGVPEYWIVNLIDRRIEVHTGPVETPSAEFGWAYASVQSHPPTAALPLPASLGADGATVRVEDVLP